MLQAVKGDPQAFSKLTAHSFLEKGVKNKQISKRKKAGSLLTARGGFAMGQVREGKEQGGFGQVPPAPAPFSPAPAVHRCGFPWKPRRGPVVPDRAPPALAPAGEGARMLAITAPDKRSRKKAAEKPRREKSFTKLNAQRALSMPRAGMRGAVAPQNLPAGASSLTSTALHHVPWR